MADADAATPAETSFSYRPTLRKRVRPAAEAEAALRTHDKYRYIMQSTKNACKVQTDGIGKLCERCPQMTQYR